jgi:LmbE family N-acetylglucosaminyl deacetylase
MSKVIIISAHPDDETLGAGGTILKHKENGDEVYWLIVTNVFESEGFSKERVLSRKQEIDEVSRLYSFDKVYSLEYPTMKLNDTFLFELVNKISHLFQELEPEIIYVMNRSDAHSDHRIVFDAVMSCTKSFRYPYVKKVLMYECLSETEFAPILPERVFQANYYVDISNFLNKKIEIMKIFNSELGEHPFPRSIKNIEALATFRGATVGVLYAEAFQMIKYIDK